jgi:beta-lactamase regulating signal transducer with metallopeptidase domain
MSAIEHLYTHPLAQAIGWALLQFVWQGAIIGVISGAALFALRRSAADVRYVVATIGLSLMLTLPVVSALQAWRTTPAGAPAGSTIATGGASAAEPRAMSPTTEPSAEIGAVSGASAAAANHAGSRSSMLPMLLLGWLCGVTVLTIRLITGWVWIRRVTSRGTSAAPPLLRDIAARMSRALHIGRAVTFLESTLVEVPIVVGWLKPIVLVPTSALAALSPTQLEAIIAHELAHIRRHDYLVNLLQTLVETLLFYHPAVWWLSRRIRIERENCCDDLAVSLCGDAVVYARALADLEGLRGGGGLALAASGASLVHRVRRLLVGAPTHAGRGPGWLAAAAAVLVIAGIAGIAAGAVGSAAVTVRQSSAPPSTPASPPEPAVAVRAATPPAPATITQARTTEPPLAAAAVPGERSAPVAATAGVPAATVAPAIATAAEQPHAAVATRAGGAAVAAVAPATAQAAATTVSSQKGNFMWSNDNDRIEIDYDGRIEFTDDDTDVKSLSPGGRLRIREGRMPNRKTVEFESDGQGNLRRRYWVGASEQPFEPEGRQWLAQTLPRFIRQSGLGAASRVARILRAKGVDGVLAEIELIQGSWAKRLYYSELLNTATIEPRAIEQILTRAGREIDSDFELASLLIGSADRLLVGEPARRAYFTAVQSIESDFEMRRVYSAALKHGAVSPDLLAVVLDGSTAIDSDFEHAELLTQVVKLQPLDGRARPAFFKALAGVDSDFEHRRVLNALATRSDLDADTLKGLFESAVLIESDFEEASLLLTTLKHHSIEGANREVFFRAVDGLGSTFERGRVLQAVAKRGDVSPDTIVAVLRATKPMGGDFETSQVLLALAASQRLSGASRDLYIDVAERLGDFEKGRALSALVKSERAIAK